jgi:hypothetical protein
MHDIVCELRFAVVQLLHFVGTPFRGPEGGRLTRARRVYRIFTRFLERLSWRGARNRRGSAYCRADSSHKPLDQGERGQHR